MEPLSAVYMTLGVVLLVASWVLMLVVSFRNDYNWGLCTLFLPPLSYFYGLFSWDKAKEVIGLSLLGWLLIFLA